MKPMEPCERPRIVVNPSAISGCSELAAEVAAEKAFDYLFDRLGQDVDVVQAVDTQGADYSLYERRFFILGQLTEQQMQFLEHANKLIENDLAKSRQAWRTLETVLENHAD